MDSLLGPCVPPESTAAPGLARAPGGAGTLASEGLATAQRTGVHWGRTKALTPDPADELGPYAPKASCAPPCCGSMPWAQRRGIALLRRRACFCRLSRHPPASPAAA